MAKYLICKNCKKFVEYKPKTKYEGGTAYTVYVCPECGYKTETSINNVHFGNDAQ